MKKLFWLWILCFGFQLLQAQVEGSWKGNLEFGGQVLPLQVHIEKRQDNTWSATFDSPNQGAFGIPFSSTVFMDGKLLCKLNAMAVKMELHLNESGKLEGTWQQGGASLPLLMERTEAPKGLTRPQEPKGPFDYKQIEVKIPHSKNKKVVLAGTLTLPQGKGPFPAVVLVSGSGPQDRNSEVFGHKPFWVLADYLTRNGIAVLRYDDRGVGKSTGDFSKATSFDLAEDAAAALAFLKKQKQIQKSLAGVVGHSEGSMLASIIANTGADPSFIVSVAGPGLPIYLLMNQQLKDVTLSELKDTTGMDSLLFFSKKLLEYAYMSPSKEQMRNGLDSFLFVMKTTYPLWVPDQVDNIVQQQMTDWFWHFIQFDPTGYWKNIHVPVLVLNGLKDVQVEGKSNAQAIYSLLPSTSKDMNKQILYPSLNHLMQNANTGAVSEYGLIEETFCPKAMQDIANWILSLKAKAIQSK